MIHASAKGSKRVRTRSLLAATMVSAMFIAACSSDDNSSSTTSAPTTTGAADTATSGEPTASADTAAQTTAPAATVAETTAPAETTPAADPLGTPKEATGDAVKVGFFTVEGGSTVSIPSIGDAGQAAADYANAYLGGLGGHKIELVRCGDKADGASATACANQFIEEGVVAVIAGQPAQADQLVPQIIKAGIPYIGASPTATSEFTSPEPFFFNPGFLGTLSAWAQYSKDQGLKKFGIFLVDNPQATAAVQALGTGLFGAAGVELQVNVIPQGTADVTSVVQTGLSQNPDILGIVGDNVVCQGVLQSLVTAGNSKPVIGISPCLQKDVVDAVGKAGLDGMLLFDGSDTISDDPEAVLYRDVMSKFAPDTDAAGITPTGYISMLGFVRSVNASGDLTDTSAASITAALKAAVNIPLPAGHGLTFSCDKSAITAILAPTICNATLLLHKVEGTTPSSDFTNVDSAALFATMAGG